MDGIRGKSVKLNEQQQKNNADYMIRDVFQALLWLLMMRFFCFNLWSLITGADAASPIPEAGAVCESFDCPVVIR